MSEQLLKSIDRSLKVLIALELRHKVDSTITTREQIERLSGFGLRPIEISDVLGRSSSYISKELSVLKKSKRKVTKE